MSPGECDSDRRPEMEAVLVLVLLALSSGDHCGVKSTVRLAGGSVCLQNRSKAPSLIGQWVAANCVALPTANAGQYATSRCKPPLFWFPFKRRYNI